MIILNLDAMRAANLTAVNLIAANDEPVHLADQDILNTWAYYNPSLVGILGCEWNARKDSNCLFPLVRYGRKEYVNMGDAPEFGGIYHGNGGILKKRKHLVNDFKDQYLKICKTWLPYNW